MLSGNIGPEPLGKTIRDMFPRDFRRSDFPRFPEPEENDAIYLRECLKNNGEAPDGSQNVMVELIMSLARSMKAKRLLDLGGGAGCLAPYLQERLWGEAEVACADKDKRTIAEARMMYNGSGVDFVVYDVNEPHDIGRFDLVFSIGLLHHLDDLPAALRNVYEELLSDPGVFNASDMARSYPPFRFTREMVYAWTEERREMSEKGKGKEGINRVIGMEVDDISMITLDSLLASYTQEEVMMAFHEAGYDQVSSHPAIGTNGSKALSVCGSRDTDGRFHLKQTDKFYEVALR